ncbi:MAG: hypothetical protein FWH03_05300 [Firmicutes bacterium]|nr:hypothetical protein [Bacillota bacterium]
MSEIRADIAKIGEFYNSNADAYEQIMLDCTNALSYLNELQRFLGDIITSAERQANRLQECVNMAEGKIYAFSEKEEYYKYEAQRIYSEGRWEFYNESERYVYDTAAYNEAERNREKYARKLSEARQLKSDAERTHRAVENFINGCMTEQRMLSQNEEHIRIAETCIEDSAEGNLQALKASLQKLMKYAQSRQFCGLA